MVAKAEEHQASNRQTYDKRYYTIGEVAEMLNVNTSLIRYWERQFQTLQPRKNRKGHRLFTKQDIDQLRYIYFLVKERHYSLNYARQALESSDSSDQEAFRLAEQLQELRKFLLELRNNLDDLPGEGEEASSRDREDRQDPETIDGSE